MNENTRENVNESAAEAKSSFEVLCGVDVQQYVEKKGNLNYLSWAYAWRELKKRYPDADYRVFENADGWIYFTDGRTCWVKVGVTVDGSEHTERLAITDSYNNALPLEKVTSVDAVNTIQRAVTKAIARHGLGLYVYAGEDLPDAGKGSSREASGKGSDVVRFSGGSSQKHSAPEGVRKGSASSAAQPNTYKKAIVGQCEKNGSDPDKVCSELSISLDNASISDLQRVISYFKSLAG